MFLTPTLPHSLRNPKHTATQLTPQSSLTHLSSYTSVSCLLGSAAITSTFYDSMHKIFPKREQETCICKERRLQFPKCLKVIPNTIVKADPFSRFVLTFVPSHFQCVFGDAFLAHNF